MTDYVTPARLRTMNLGTDLSGYTDLQIASALSRSARVLEAYTNAPMLPQRHSFRGGTVTGERQRWRYPMTPFEVGQRRVYPFHTPLLELTSLRIYVTNTQYVEIDPSEVVYQPTERYLEVVSLALTSAGLFNALIIPNVGLATPFGVLNYTYGALFPVTDALCYPTDSGGLVYQAPDQFWTDSAPEVMVNGVLTTPASYDITEGTITFAAPQTGSVTASYTGTCPPEIAAAQALIAAYELGETAIRARGLVGLDSIKMGELTVTRARRDYARQAASASNLRDTVPEAAELLDGFVFYRASGLS